jgi:hypothetical protein
MYRAKAQSEGWLPATYRVGEVLSFWARRRPCRFLLSSVITVYDNSHAGTENDEMPRPYWYRLEPCPDVFAENAVLDDRSKSGLAILRRSECR